jgi:hypothetical protein
VADHAGLIEEGLRIADAADDAGLRVRLLGGVGVVAHCPGVLGGRPHREIADIDVAVTRRDARALTGFLEGLGYEPERRFNALHGDTRMIFRGPAGKLDVFVGSFSMCHALEIDGRLELDFPALTATDLLLTKLQIVELNAKDAHDASVLLAEHPIAEGPGDHVDVTYVSRLTSDDWGLWRTVTATLEHLAELHPAVADRCRALREAVHAAPKSRRFKLRARVGERVRWYELPEESVA